MLVSAPVFYLPITLGAAAGGISSTRALITTRITTTDVLNIKISRPIPLNRIYIRFECATKNTILRETVDQIVMALYT